jgi:hypothetical protein
MLEKYPDILSVEDLRVILKVGKNKIYKLLQDRIIKSRKIGKVYKIPKKYLIEFILEAN